MEDTVFHKIVRGEIPVHKIYENDQVLAFLDANPVNPGHTLIIPKTFSKNIIEADTESAHAIMDAIQLLAPKIQKAVTADGINIMSNIESAAGQEVFYTHIHLIPRFDEDNFTHWHGKEKYHDEDRGTKIRDSIVDTLA